MHNLCADKSTHMLHTSIRSLSTWKANLYCLYYKTPILSKHINYRYNCELLLLVNNKGHNNKIIIIIQLKIRCFCYTVSLRHRDTVPLYYTSMKSPLLYYTRLETACVYEGRSARTGPCGKYEGNKIRIIKKGGSPSPEACSLCTAETIRLVNTGRQGMVWPMRLKDTNRPGTS